MFRMQTLGDLLGVLEEGVGFGVKVSVWAAVRVSVVKMRALRGGDGGEGVGWRVRVAMGRSTEVCFFLDLLLIGSSSVFWLFLTFRRPWPLRLMYAASSWFSVSGLPIVSGLKGGGSTMSSLLSTPLLAFEFEARRAGMTLLMTCFACFARMSFRTAGGARPWDFSVRPIS